MSRSPADKFAVRNRSTVLSQGLAVIRKNALEHRRNWRSHLILLLSPLLFCGLMVLLQVVVNNAISSVELFQVYGAFAETVYVVFHIPPLMALPLSCFKHRQDYSGSFLRQCSNPVIA